MRYTNVTRAQVFEADRPSTPLPAFDFTSNDPIRKLVIIPAAKYPAFAPKEPQFVGWAGQIMAYEGNKKKLKIKIYNDYGYEHLPIKNGKWAVESLERLA